MTRNKPKSSDTLPPPDDVNARIGVLTRREVEARILGPLIEALSESFDRERVLEVVRDTITRLAQTQGGEMAESLGGNSSAHLMDSLQYWTKEDALEIQVLEQDQERLSFNVTRCRYAELYQALGIAELGAILSCNRDFSFVEGFNPRASLERTQTIMEGAPLCDFRFTFKVAETSEASDDRTAE